MVISAENKIGDLNSNSRQGCLHSLCSNAFEKDMNPLY